MHPVVISFGDFHVFSYGLCIAIGILVSLFLMHRQAKKDGFPPVAQILDMVFFVVMWGIIGARLFYVFQNFSYYGANPLDIIKVWQGGLVFYGGAISGFVSFIYWTRNHGWGVWQSLDFLTPYVALSHVFGRMGCFLNGCCYGKPSDLPFAVQFPALEYKVHPTQIYEAAFNVGLFFFLRLRAKRKHFSGEIGLLYFMLYALGRYLVEFLRESSWTWQGLTANQLISAGIILIAFVFFKVRKAKRN